MIGAALPESLMSRFRDLGHVRWLMSTGGITRLSEVVGGRPDAYLRLMSPDDINKVRSARTPKVDISRPWCGWSGTLDMRA
jgi:hypothetical protein